MDKIEARCACGASLKIETDFSLDRIIAAMLIWQRLHTGCRQLAQPAQRPTRPQLKAGPE